MQEQEGGHGVQGDQQRAVHRQRMLLQPKPQPAGPGLQQAAQSLAAFCGQQVPAHMMHGLLRLGGAAQLQRAPHEPRLLHGEAPGQHGRLLPVAQAA